MAYTDSEDLNYRGELFNIGGDKTPFITMMGGLGAGQRRNSFLFPMAQPWALGAASQPAITETVSATAGIPDTYTRSEDTNTVQIWQAYSEVTFMKQSQSGSMSGINTNDDNPVKDELTQQQEGALKTLAKKMEYTFLNGSYQQATDSTTAAKTRGIVTASAAGTNSVAAGGAALSKALIDELMLEMATNGAIFENMVVFVNGRQKQLISDIYGYPTPSRNVGGLNIMEVETDFCKFGVVWDKQMETDDLLIAEMSVCQPVFVPVTFGANGPITNMTAGSEVLWVPTAITAASFGGFFYAQAGIDYGPEEYHGTITGLATG